MPQGRSHAATTTSGAASARSIVRPSVTGVAPGAANTARPAGPKPPSGPGPKRAAGGPPVPRSACRAGLTAGGGGFGEALVGGGPGDAAGVAPTAAVGRRNGFADLRPLDPSHVVRGVAGQHDEGAIGRPIEQDVKHRSDGGLRES